MYKIHFTKNIIPLTTKFKLEKSFIVHCKFKETFEVLASCVCKVLKKAIHCSTVHSLGKLFVIYQKSTKLSSRLTFVVYSMHMSKCIMIAMKL